LDNTAIETGVRRKIAGSSFAQYKSSHVITLRKETTDDHDAVRTLTVDAFAHSEFGHNGEAELIDTIRAASVNQLSLVACSDGEIVGHILFTPVTISTSLHDVHGMGLAPMSVAPQHQKTGIGSLLVTNGLERLLADACPFVVVLGHPDYYSRFGFQPAAPFDIFHGFSGIPQEVFFIRSLSINTMKQMPDGRAYYLPEFGPQHDVI